MKGGSAAEGGRRHCDLQSVIKRHSCNGSCLLELVNENGICVLVCFFTV